jgi:DNA-binding response OmpR family regulator
MIAEKKILLVEDDPSLGFVIKDNLTMRGYTVTLCTDGEAGERSFRTGDFNLCIFDVMLPKKDGFALARTVRESDKEIPILFLTAKSMTVDKLTGFQTGADDYITKPFNLEELLYRMEVFLRRTSEPMPAPERTFPLGQYHFDYTTYTLRLHDTEKTLTQKEAEVLQLLYQHRTRVLKREEILKHVWGDDDYFMGRSMDVFISKLRKYLKEDPSVRIVNYHGVGFRLELEQ